MAHAEEPFNRLIREKSPYLLQHAHNPVDWYPWGDEAFLKAKREDKPVFLSIGYSTCHWCHVMEEESFSDPEIANILNRYFISIKVDREERPDLDSTYMGVVQAMTGSGGWPLNLFLTPDKKPFFGGTYFPPDNLKGLLSEVAGAWKNKRSEILQSSVNITNALNSIEASSKEKSAISSAVFDDAFKMLSSQYDPVYGGFGSSIKFPTGHTLSFLLRYYHRTGNKKALQMVENTLEHIAEGGIFDHLGGGFHRYSTDQKWFLPHFEKMLYDQAILTNVYLEAYQITKKEEYAAAARRVFDYVLRDMAYPEGGFYSAEDADSAPDRGQPGKKSEGAYYVWTEDEIMGALGKEHGGIFSYRYGVKSDGNVKIDPWHEFDKKNVLYPANSTEDTAAHFKKSEAEVDDTLKLSEQKLFRKRSGRLRPHLDDKVLTDWNGLMISSLAKGGRILNEPRYTIASQKAADFIINSLKTKDGRLLHRFRDGESGIPGFLDDYAFFINGLLDLYEATLELPYLKEAVNLSDVMIELFSDKKAGGFFFAQAGSETILANRPKEYYDGAIPSGNSMASQVLLRLYRITLRKDLEKAYNDSLDYISKRLTESPSAFAQLLIAVDAAMTPAKDIVIASGHYNDPEVSAITAVIYSYFLPSKIMLFRSVEGTDGMVAIAPWTKEYSSLAGGKTTVYICQNQACRLPITDLTELKKILQIDRLRLP